MSGGTSEEQYAGRQPRGHIITKSEDIQRDLGDKDTVRSVRTLSESQQVRLTSTSDKGECHGYQENASTRVLLVLNPKPTLS